MNKRDRREMNEALRYSIGDEKNESESQKDINDIEDWNAVLSQLDYANDEDTLEDDNHEPILPRSSGSARRGADEDNALGFLSDALEGSAYTSARLLGRVRKTSDTITNELGGKADRRRKASGRLGHFTGYETRAEIIEADSFFPEGRLEVYLYGNEQIAAGLTDEPALTFVIAPDGELLSVIRNVAHPYI